ncbi:MAG TPA: biotin carboxylase N-terminal domain-containing protein [Candidatus Limnocylindrales bacterium]
MSDELSPSQAAARIGATTRSVQRWIARGSLPARRVGGRWRVASDALDAFVAWGVPPASGAPAVVIQALFVANRGEIAARIGRTALRLGIRTIVPGLDGAPPVDLLDAPAVVAAARAAGADAVHPGYGFLAEQAAFAAAVEAAGIRWVGPPAAAIRAMGDKAAARRLAAELGIDTLPGYDDADQSDEALTAAGARIGVPLIVKPSAGGGGKGMRIVRDLATLTDALAAARREARASFADEHLILERYVEGPRHVEVQVLFDGHGGGVHLGERDCSLQRRHQKILEETPSPGLDRAVRGEIVGAALRLAAAVGYRSAGTCEFLVADDGRATFLEMNTRLQVEHPVTEAVTGRDLVADQLAIAAGARLADIGLDQADVDRRLRAGGHAVEVRIYAEDAEAGFLPATGRVEALAWPAGDGIRVDAGIAVGTEVGPRFDPLLAKIVAAGADRAEAFARLERALDETVVLGLVTNLRFLRWLVREPLIREGRIRTDTLERVWPPGDLPERSAVPAEAWSAAASLLAGMPAEPSAAAPDAFAGAWRLNGPRVIRLAAGDLERTVAVPTALTDAVPTAADRPRGILAAETAHVDVDGRSVAFRIAPPPDVDRAARAAAAHIRGGGPRAVEAPMPGAVVAVHIQAGDVVETGSPLVTLEAMKMEHVVVAPGPGHVTEVLVRPGAQVGRGQALATIDDAALPLPPQEAP